MRAFGLIFGITCLALPASLQAKPFQINRVQMSSKHPLVHFAPRKGGEASIRIQFQGGSFDDGHTAGLTRLAQQAMLRGPGSQRYERFILDLYAAGGTIEIETGVQDSAFVLTAPTAQFESLAERLITFCLRPKITPQAFNAAKSLAIQDQQNVGVNAFTSFLAQTVITDRGFTNDPLGDKDTIRVLKLRSVRSHISRVMAPANAHVVVAGNFKPKRMKKLLSQFTGGKRLKRKRPTGDLAGNYHMRTYVEMHLLAYPTTITDEKSAAALRMVSVILEERIRRKFRKKGIAYSASAVAIRKDWLDFLMIFLPIHSENPQPIAKELEAEIVEVRTGSLSEDEIDRARAQTLARLAAIDADSSSLANEIAAARGGSWFNRKVRTAVENIGKEELVRLSSRWLENRRAIHVVLSPRNLASAAKGGRQ